MNTIKYIAIIFFAISLSNLQAEIYTLKDNENIVYSVIEDINNYAFVLEVSNIYSKKISYNLVHNNEIKTDYLDFYSIDILKNKTLIAIMYGGSKAKDSWYIIYGNKEYEYDEIDRVVVDKNANVSLIFARYLEYGYAIVNGATNTKYTTLFDAALKHNRYAYSYSRDEQYFINIDGVEKSLLGEAYNITFSDDASKLAYVIKTEDSAKLVYDNVESSMYKSIEDVLFSYNNELLYTAVLMEEVNNTNEMLGDIEYTNFNQSQNIMTNATTNTITNKIISELAIAPNNTIGLVDVPIFETIISNRIITNTQASNITKTTVFLDGRKYGDYDFIRDIYFSPDSKVLSFIAKENNKYHLVSSGNLSDAYNDIYFLKYFPDSKMFVYVVRSSNNIVSAINSDEKVIVNADFIGNIYISDSILAYSVTKNKREYIITKGFESPSYSTINNFIFINNGYGFAFTASRGDKQYYFTFDKNSNTKLESSHYKYISSIFTDDNNNALAVVQKDNKLYMLENGNEVLINK